MKAKFRDTRFALLVALLSVVPATFMGACSPADVEPLPDPPPTEAASVPLLTSEFTLGTTLYGGADLPASGTAERALLDTAVARGLRGFTYYVDWADLEPEPGRYTLAEFQATLDDLQQLGVRPLVNITVGDIEDYNLPDGLSDGQGGLAEGVSLDDPAVIERFGRLLDRVVPILLDHGGFVLGVGNEVDARFDGPHPDERAAYVRFVEAARERVHAMEPQLAVGVTLTSYAVRDRSQTFRRLRGVTDVVPFNYAPIDPSFLVQEQATINADFQAVLSAYGEGPILIQELTCPSAPSMDASEAWQQACFERLFEEVDATAQVRFASVFTFQDLDAETCSRVRDLIFGDELDDLPEEVAERLSEYLCQLGVVTPDGTPKLAWDTVLDGAESLTD
jgi:hypothetical protein